PRPAAPLLLPPHVLHLHLQRALLLRVRGPRASALVPYTTLFRSALQLRHRHLHRDTHVWAEQDRERLRQLPQRPQERDEVRGLERGRRQGLTPASAA